MVTSITLGNFFSSGGRTVAGNLSGSGLDTEALIDGLVEARRLSIVNIEDKIEINTNKSDALSQLQTLLGTFQDASNILRKVPGFNKAADNAFDYVTASISSDTAIAGSNYLSVTVNPGTVEQSFTINEITSVAREKKQRTGDFSIADANTQVVYTGAGAGQFEAGTVTVNGVDITLEDGDTLSLVAAKFNAVKNDTGIAASVVKISDGTFRLQFSATETGLDADFDLGDPGTVTDPGGVFTNITFTQTQAASNAVFDLDGQTITRQSNNINDVLTGITFNLLQATPSPDDTDLTVRIEPDTTVAKNAIIGFINAYNDVKVFAAEQTQLSANGEFADEAYLGTSSTLRTILNQVSSELSKVVDGIASSNLRQLGDIGISFADLPESDESPFTRNILTLDESELDSALSANFEQVRKVFEFSFESDNPNLTSFTRTNALGVSSFTLDVNPGTSTYQATYDLGSGPVTIDLDATAFSTGDGYTLTGQAGTVLEGLVLIYASTDTASINVTASQGIADRLYNFIEDINDEDSGTLAVQIESLSESTENLQEDILRLEDRLDTYRQQLIERFARLEQAISSVNTLLQTLDAQDLARQNS